MTRRTTGKSSTVQMGPSHRDSRLLCLPPQPTKAALEVKNHLFHFIPGVRSSHDFPFSINRPHQATYSTSNSSMSPSSLPPRQRFSRGDNRLREDSINRMGTDGSLANSQSKWTRTNGVVGLLR